LFAARFALERFAGLHGASHPSFDWKEFEYRISVEYLKDWVPFVKQVGEEEIETRQSRRADGEGSPKTPHA
jgi:hypothetical protein